MLSVSAQKTESEKYFHFIKIKRLFNLPLLLLTSKSGQQYCESFKNKHKLKTETATETPKFQFNNFSIICEEWSDGNMGSR